MAEQFGQNLQGLKSRDLMSSADYKKLFGEVVDGQAVLPQELEKACEKYNERLLKEQSNANTKVKQLMAYLNEQKSSKKPMNKAEVDQIVEQIRAMEPRENTLTIDEIRD